VISQTYDSVGGHGVEVQGGDEDHFGDPAIAATERNTRPRVEEEDDGTDEESTEPEKQIVVRHARPRSKCSVNWPEGAPTGRRIVEVKMLLTVKTSGRVGKVRVLRSAGEPFDSAAIGAMKACRFSAGTRDGVAFVDRVPFVVEFRPNAN
jgi:TonB family protein